MTQQAADSVTRVKLWDPLLRVFHWSLAACVISAWGLGEFGPNIMTLHFYCGYAVIGLVAFRIVWGLAGPAPARFSHFIYAPRTFFAYLSKIGRREPSYWPGHNPVGALSVFALLAAVAVQAGTGLFIDPDDYINVGPLADTVSRETQRTANQIHDKVAWLILALVVLHLAAIAFYKTYKREDLVRPMITGWKLVRKDADPAE